MHCCGLIRMKRLPELQRRHGGFCFEEFTERCLGKGFSNVRNRTRKYNVHAIDFVYTKLNNQDDAAVAECRIVVAKRLLVEIV